MSQFKSFIEGIIQPSRHSTDLVETVYLDLEKRDLPLYNTFALDYAKYLQSE